MDQQNEDLNNIKQEGGKVIDLWTSPAASLPPPPPPFREQKRKYKFPRIAVLVKSSLKFLVSLAVTFTAVYCFLNFPVIEARMAYWWQENTQKEQPNVEVLPPISEETPGTIVPTPSVNQIRAQNNFVIIPKIKVNAPIIWMQSADEKDILADLQKGVGHYPGTAMPGEVGNVFLTGHSSYYWWSNGKYNNVFALLEKLVVGDMIYIGYKDQTFAYKVKKMRVVTPKQVDVLLPTEKSILTLLTCTPVGTAINRLVVVADQVSPDPALNGKPFGDGLPTVNTLPAVDLPAVR